MFTYAPIFSTSLIVIAARWDNTKLIHLLCIWSESKNELRFIAALLWQFLVHGQKKTSSLVRSAASARMANGVGFKIGIPSLGKPVSVLDHIQTVRSGAECSRASICHFQLDRVKASQVNFVPAANLPTSVPSSPDFGQGVEPDSFNQLKHWHCFLCFEYKLSRVMANPQHAAATPPTKQIHTLKKEGLLH